MAGRRVSVGGTLVLDGEGLAKLAMGNLPVRARLEAARTRGARVVVSSVTLTEVLRGGRGDAAVHRVLSRVTVLPVTPEIGRAAGELLGSTGLSGHRCALDAVVAATALGQSRPVVLLTSDPHDMGKLVDEPARPEEQRVVVVHV
ncbi:MAG: PIN domain-containing protein [Saccharothrix sp.]|nr:PIN domain-containing protein [Saccharothrix sp.]